MTTIRGRMHHSSDDAGQEQFMLWPHRSLSGAGTACLLGLALLGLTVPLATIAAAPFWPMVVPAVLTFSLLSAAIWKNNRSARMGEIIRLEPGVIRVERWHAVQPEVVAEFSSYWVRVSLQSDFYVEDRLVLKEGRRSCSVGEFLAPEERRALADALREHLSRQKQAY